jgi:hypothetical protein
MSVEHFAQVYTEMLNDSSFKERVRSNLVSAAAGWYLTEEERRILTQEAQNDAKEYSVSGSPALAYVARMGPISQTAGTALGNAINRASRLPVAGPLEGGCDAGCCKWAALFNFQSLVRN